MGSKRPPQCEHGNWFVSEKTLETERRRASEPRTGGASRNPRQRKPMKRSEPKRDWNDAHEKIAEEGCCRICKRTDRKLEAAHVLGREHDEPKIGRDGWSLKELYVDPNRIFPACGPFPDGCHGDVDYRRINVLPFLTLEEQIQAVKDAGGIEAARIRLAPVEHREEVEEERYAPDLIAENEQLRGRVAELEEHIAA